MTQVTGTSSGVCVSPDRGLAVGIETRDGTFTPVLLRGLRLPVQNVRTFTTVADNQTRIEVHVLQGVSDLAADCESLAKFEITGLPPAPKGVPQIDVTFEIDLNAILTVTARDSATGLHASAKILPQSVLWDRLFREEAARAEGEPLEIPGKGRERCAECGQVCFSAALPGFDTRCCKCTNARPRCETCKRREEIP
jgi:molecular chaperone DnaK (HSP70)